MNNKVCLENEIRFILNNIRYEDRIELTALFGADWKEKTFNRLKGKKFTVLYGYDFFGAYVPVAMGGIKPISNKTPHIACVWLLSSKYIHKNKSGLIKILKSEFSAAEEKYDFMFNFIHKSNKSAKKWLKKFGFRFDNPYPKNIDVPKEFEFFYKVNEKKGK